MTSLDDIAACVPPGIVAGPAHTGPQELDYNLDQHKWAARGWWRGYPDQGRITIEYSRRQ